MPHKRKRDDDDSIDVEIVPSPSTGSVGPLLVSFPALHPPKDTPFKCYARNKEDASDVSMVVGEAPQVEFISNEEETRRVAEHGCRYLLAVRDPKTSKLKILSTPKSPFILTRTVKALKSIPPADEPTPLAYHDARTALGETFGTKKARAAIRAHERNRVDVGAMEGVMQHVVEGIDEKAEGLLTKEEAKDLADSTRLIPPFSATATEPGDVYPLNEIIPDAEFKALNATPVEENLKSNNPASMLPFKYCKWVNNHLKRLGQDGEKSKARKRKLKILLYVSTMFLFRRVISHPKGMDKDTVYEKMNNVPTIVVDGLLSRFTETTRGSSVHLYTSAMSTKFLAYLLALCLRVDDFASNPKTLADDLSMRVQEIQTIYRSLGCKLKTLSEHQLSSRGLSDTLGDTKFAVLTAPVQFPNVRTRRAKRT
ncbi:hypothetical protein GYMLUDRAFT_39451 [Collybiopsis luxurians FD-317 M1]|nr:hypothetical protein GYMLUDRAFT_39451 [Collybiopsis luxurians FD-317 M1]